ncbi:hypothetical protein H2198_010381 [Neophaeococcomyces mojaviensis]|uniref:Uncharacterized protein n=1 Tax=Neophaeococcomyces mojaviensis TaxID=3383035 RepID=A0ACC2ZRW3_9EURO|nr:hypothetical protein H2198_010381 [Knufia sp. JES_112]
MGLLRFGTTALALAASAHCFNVVPPANGADVVTETFTRFVFTCPCDATTSVSLGTVDPTSPANDSENHGWQGWSVKASRSSESLVLTGPTPTNRPTTRSRISSSRSLRNSSYDHSTTYTSALPTGPGFSVSHGSPTSSFPIFTSHSTTSSGSTSEAITTTSSYAYITTSTTTGTSTSGAQYGITSSSSATPPISPSTSSTTSAPATTTTTGSVTNHFPPGTPFVCTANIRGSKLRRRDTRYLSFGDGAGLLVADSTQAVPLTLSSEGVLRVVSNGMIVGAPSASGVQSFEMVFSYAALTSGWSIGDSGLQHDSVSFCLDSRSLVYVSFDTTAADCTPFSLVPTTDCSDCNLPGSSGASSTTTSHTLEAFTTSNSLTTFESTTSSTTTFGYYPNTTTTSQDTTSTSSSSTSSLGTTSSESESDASTTSITTSTEQAVYDATTSSSAVTSTTSIGLPYAGPSSTTTTNAEVAQSSTSTMSAPAISTTTSSGSGVPTSSTTTSDSSDATSSTTTSNINDATYSTTSSDLGAATSSTTTSDAGAPTSSTTTADLSGAASSTTTSGSSDATSSTTTSDSSAAVSSTTTTDEAQPSATTTSTTSSQGIADGDHTTSSTTSMTTMTMTITTSSSSSTTLSADTSIPTTGQPFSIQVEVTSTHRKRDIMVVGFVNGQLVLVSSPADAVAFVLTPQGVLMIFNTGLVVGFGGGSGTSALMIYSSVDAMPTVLTWSFAGGALVLPGAGFCVGSGNVMSVNVGTATDDACAPVTPVPDTASDSYNTAVASAVTPSPQTSTSTSSTISSSSTTVEVTTTSASAVISTTSSTTVPYVSTSTTTSSTSPTPSTCDPDNSVATCPGDCIYCVAQAGNDPSCASLTYCASCNTDADCSIWGTGFSCGSYITCSDVPGYSGNVCFKAESASCPNNVLLSTTTAIPSTITSTISVLTSSTTTSSSTATTDSTTSITTATASTTSITTTSSTTKTFETSGPNCSILPIPSLTAPNGADYTQFFYGCFASIPATTGNSLTVLEMVPGQEDPTSFLARCLQTAEQDGASVWTYYQSTDFSWGCGLWSDVSGDPNIFQDDTAVFTVNAFALVGPANQNASTTVSIQTSTTTSTSSATPIPPLDINADCTYVDVTHQIITTEGDAFTEFIGGCGYATVNGKGFTMFTSNYYQFSDGWTRQAALADCAEFAVLHSGQSFDFRHFQGATRWECNVIREMQTISNNTYLSGYDVITETYGFSLGDVSADNGDVISSTTTSTMTTTMTTTSVTTPAYGTTTVVSTTTSSLVSPTSTCTGLCNTSSTVSAGSRSWSQVKAGCTIYNADWAWSTASMFPDGISDCTAIENCAIYTDQQDMTAFRVFWVPTENQWHCDVGTQDDNTGNYQFSSPQGSFYMYNSIPIDTAPNVTNSSTTITTTIMTASTTTSSLTTTSATSSCVPTEASVGDLVSTDTNDWINFFSSGCGLSMDWAALSFNSLYVYQRSDYTFEEALLECAETADNDGSPVFEFETDIRNNNRWVCWTFPSATTDPTQFQPYGGIADAYGYYAPSRLASTTTTSSTSTTATSSLAATTTPACQSNPITDSNGDGWQVICDTVRLGGAPLLLDSDVTMEQCIEQCNTASNCNGVEIGPDQSGTVYCWGITADLDWTPTTYAGWDAALKVTGDLGRDPEDGDTLVTSTTSASTTTVVVMSSSSTFTSSTTTSGSQPTSTFYIVAGNVSPGRMIKRQTTAEYLAFDLTTGLSSLVDSQADASKFTTSDDGSLIVAGTSTAYVGFSDGTPTRLVLETTKPSPIVTASISSDGSLTITGVVAKCILDGGLVVSTDGQTPSGCQAITLTIVSAESSSSSCVTTTVISVIAPGATATRVSTVCSATLSPTPLPTTTVVPTTTTTTTSSTPSPTCVNGGIVTDTDGYSWEMLCGQGNAYGWDHFSSYADVNTLEDCIGKCNEDTNCNGVSIEYRDAPDNNLCGFIYTSYQFEAYPFDTDTAIRIEGPDARSEVVVADSSTTSSTTTTATSTTSSTTSTPTCTNAPLGDVVALYDTTQTFSNFYTGCSQSMEGGVSGGLGYLPKQFAVQWQAPDYEGYTFDDAVSRCVQFAVDNGAIAVEFYEDVDQNWMCVGVADVTPDASLFFPDSNVVNVWGFVWKNPCGNSPLGDAVSTDGTVFTEFYTGCSTSLEGNLAGGLRYLNRVVSTNWLPDNNYGGWTLDTALVSCADQSVANGGNLFEFYISSDSIWYCVAVNDKPADASSFYSDASVGKVWGFALSTSSSSSSSTTTTVLTTSTSTAAATPTCTPSSMGDVTASDGTTLDEFYDACGMSLEGNTPGGVGGMNPIWATIFPPYDDQSYGGWTLDTALVHCIDDAKNAGSTVIEFYETADAIPTWWCVGFDDITADPSSFYADVNVGRIWAFEVEV